MTTQTEAPILRLSGRTPLAYDETAAADAVASWAQRGDLYELLTNLCLLECLHADDLDEYDQRMIEDIQALCQERIGLIQQIQAKHDDIDWEEDLL